MATVISHSGESSLNNPVAVVLCLACALSFVYSLHMVSWGKVQIHSQLLLRVAILVYLAWSLVSEIKVYMYSAYMAGSKNCLLLV